MDERIQRDLQDRIEAFARDITAILQRAVSDAITGALGRGSTTNGRATTRVARDRAGRRTRAQVSADTDALLREVRRKRGQRMEQIAKNLGTTTKALVVPMNALLKSKKVKKSGVARGTVYRAS